MLGLFKIILQLKLYRLPWYRLDFFSVLVYQCFTNHFVVVSIVGVSHVRGRGQCCSCLGPYLHGSSCAVIEDFYTYSVDTKTYCACLHSTGGYRVTVCCNLVVKGQDPMTRADEDIEGGQCSIVIIFTLVETGKKKNTALFALCWYEHSSSCVTLCEH